MNRVNSLLIFLLFSTSLSCFAVKPEDNAIWGTIVSPKDQLSEVPYKYFVYFEKDGQQHAYPIEATQKLTETMDKNLNQKVRIQGEVKEVSLQLDGPKKKILVFIPKAIKPLTLSELSAAVPVQTRPIQASGLHDKPEQGYDGGGIRINDNVANAMIYTGAAVLLGSRLGKIVFKTK